jgi:hypothetical protein
MSDNNARGFRKKGLGGMVRDGNRWLFYYGGATKNMGVATAPVHETSSGSDGPTSGTIS